MQNHFQLNIKCTSTFNKWQCLKFDNIFVAIPRRSVTFLLLLQRSLVIRIDLVDKFTRHTGAELRLRCSVDDMYQNGTFDFAARKILFHVLRPHPVSNTLLGPNKISATLSAILRDAAKYRHKQLQRGICTAGRNMPLPYDFHSFRTLRSVPRIFDQQVIRPN